MKTPQGNRKNKRLMKTFLSLRSRSFCYILAGDTNKISATVARQFRVAATLFLPGV